MVGLTRGSVNIIVAISFWKASRRSRFNVKLRTVLPICTDLLEQSIGIPLVGLIRVPNLESLSNITNYPSFKII